MFDDMTDKLSDSEYHKLLELNWEKLAVIEGVMRIEGISLDSLAEASGIYPLTLEMWMDYQVLLNEEQLENISAVLNILA